MKKINRIAWLAGVVLMAGGGAYGLADYFGVLPSAFSPAQNQETAAHQPPKPPLNARTISVLVDRVQRVDIPIEITAVGSVQASQSVSVRSRIDGAILQIHFTEGDEVKAGDTLFTLDARAIEAQIRQAEANLARDRVALSNASRDANRYQSLARSDFVARQKLDDAMALVQSAENTVKANEANVEGLKVQLSYTRILAPIDGRSGRINLTKGNIARANDPAPLVVINQIKPVNLIFAAPQRYFPDLRSAIAMRDVTVTAEAPGKGKVEGAVDFLDNSIDPSSGAFQVKARFANLDGALWPGMFVPATVRLGVEAGALVVPSQTVQSGQQAFYLYVVTPDNQAELRPVTVLRHAGGRAVIGSGVQEGERVVVEGQMRLFPGARVEPLYSLAPAS